MSDATQPTTDPTPGSYIVCPDLPHLGGNIAGGDERTHVPEVWQLLKDRLGIASVFDVGCGTGETMAWWSAAGCDALGMDGLAYNVKQAAKHGAVTLNDLAQSGVRVAVDLVWCSEVVEHIDRRHLLNLLRTITCGKYLAMTFALPGQGGHHHVNEQPEVYWIDVLRASGMGLMADLTAESRALVTPDKFWHHTGLIFQRVSIEPTR